MDTGSFPGVESGRGVTLTPHPLLVPRSKNRLSLRTFVAYEKSENLPDREKCEDYRKHEYRIVTESD
jgi:hypothetical protein